MATLAAIVGGIGGICAVLGILTATEVIPLPFGEQYTWMFWFMLSAILLLATIVFSVGRGGNGYD